MDLENPPDVLKDLLVSEKRLDIYWSIIGWWADGKKIEFQMQHLSDERYLIIEDLGWEVILLLISEGEASLKRLLEACGKIEIIVDSRGVKWLWFRVNRRR